MDKKFFFQKEELVGNNRYLTKLSDYIRKDGVADYVWEYISLDLFLMLSKEIPHIAQDYTKQWYNIPIVYHAQEGILVEDEFNDLIRQYLDQRAQEISEVFSNDSQIEWNVNYEHEIYGAVEDFKRIVEEYCFDRETLLSFQQEINELKKSLQTFLHTDLSQKIKNYNEDTSLEDPIIQQVEFINKRLDRFIKMQPEPIHTIIMRRHDGHFNDIEGFSFHYLHKRYHSSNEKVQNKDKELSQEELYNQSIDELRISIFQLNNIFFTPEERANGSKIHEIQKPVLQLFDSILKYIWSIQQKPEHTEQFNTITRKLNLFIAQFLNNAYQHLPDSEKIAEIMNITQNLGSSIYDALENILVYKKYEIFSAEYTFTKEILTKLQQDYVNYPDTDVIEPSILERFEELHKLDLKYVKSLSSDELQSLITIAIYYEQFAFLNKLQDNKLIPSTKKID